MDWLGARHARGRDRGHATRGIGCELRNYVRRRVGRRDGERFESIDPATGEVARHGAGHRPARGRGRRRRRAARRGRRRWAAVARPIAPPRCLARRCPAGPRARRRRTDRAGDGQARPARSRPRGGRRHRQAAGSSPARRATLDGRFVGAPDDALWDMEIPEPVGVAALIIPWNDPVDLPCASSAPPSRRAAPSSSSRRSSLPHPPPLVSSCIDAIDLFPPGRRQPRARPRRPDRRRARRHPGVDKVSFTGSTATGIAIARAAAERLAKVSLECGGKAPGLVFADADLDRCLDALAYGAFMYSRSVLHRVHAPHRRGARLRRVRGGPRRALPGDAGRRSLRRWRPGRAAGLAGPVRQGAAVHRRSRAATAATVVPGGDDGRTRRSVPRAHGRWPTCRRTAA